MKEYNLKFGLYYEFNNWHVVIPSDDDTNDLKADCDSTVFMGYVNEEPLNYIHPIKISLRSKKEMMRGFSIKLNYETLCPQCRNKYNLTKEDINHYIVLAKFGIKI